MSVFEIVVAIGLVVVVAELRNVVGAIADLGKKLDAIESNTSNIESNTERDDVDDYEYGG